MVTFSKDTTLNTIKATHLEVILRDSISNISVNNEDTSTYRAELDSLFRANVGLASSAELEDRKLRLISWLQKNRIPVEQSGENGVVLNVANAAVILAPYGVSDCQSTNEVILGKIQALVKALPKT